MKKYLNKSLLVVAVATGTFLLSSCLKNNEYHTDFSKYKPSIELPLAATNLNAPIGMDWSPDTTTYFEIYVNVASVNPLGQTVTATLDIDQEWLDSYNAQQAAAAKQAQEEYLEDESHSDTDPGYPYDWIPMELLPDSLYELTIDDQAAKIPFELTVPAKERQAYAKALFKTDHFPVGHNYVLPLTITQSSSIAISSWNHLPLWFVTSQFSGSFEGYHVAISGKVNDAFDDPGMTLSTINQHTVAQGSIGDYFGGYTEYTFLGDGSVAVKAGTGPSDPTSYGAEVIDSWSDATTGEFYVDFKILGGSYEFKETFKRK